MARDDHRCVRCGTADGPISLQHRVARGMGGTRNPAVHSPANLIVLCGDGTSGCHGRVEQRAQADHDAGYWLRRDEDPAAARVLHWTYGPVLLTPTGGYGWLGGER